MEHEQVFRCDHGTVIARGTVNQKALEEGCRKAVLMDMRAKAVKKREERRNAS